MRGLVSIPPAPQHHGTERGATHQGDNQRSSREPGTSPRTHRNCRCLLLSRISRSKWHRGRSHRPSVITAINNGPPPPVASPMTMALRARQLPSPALARAGAPPTVSAQAIARKLASSAPAKFFNPGTTE